jgi:hypothetical protein
VTWQPLDPFRCLWSSPHARAFPTSLPDTLLVRLVEAPKATTVSVLCWWHCPAPGSSVFRCPWLAPSTPQTDAPLYACVHVCVWALTASFHFLSATAKLVLPPHKHSTTLANSMAAFATSLFVFKGAPPQQRLAQSLVLSGVVGTVSHFYGVDL